MASDIFQFMVVLVKRLSSDWLHVSRCNYPIKPIMIFQWRIQGFSYLCKPVIMDALFGVLLQPNQLSCWHSHSRLKHTFSSQQWCFSCFVIDSSNWILAEFNQNQWSMIEGYIKCFKFSWSRACEFKCYRNFDFWNCFLV